MSNFSKLKWYDYLFETQDDSYIQKLFKVPFRLKVKKKQGGNKSETEDDIRAAPSVTSLSLPRDRRRDDEYWHMTYDVKFELPMGTGLNAREYVSQKLLDDLLSIPGLAIHSYGEPYQVYDAQDDMIGNPDTDRSKIFGGDLRRQSKGEEEDV